jgi:hypothetical protein
VFAQKSQSPLLLSPYVKVIRFFLTRIFDYFYKIFNENYGAVLPEFYVEFPESAANIHSNKKKWHVI